MSYRDQYQHYLDELPTLVKYSNEFKKAPIFAYTSNLDVVLHWDVNKYNEILETYLKEKPNVREGDTINTMEDFARISSYYLIRGLGGNFDITNIEVCNYLKELFTFEYSLGGTSAQGAAAFGTIGFPVNIHLTDACEEVCQMMNHTGTSVVKDNQSVPIMKSISGEEPVYHFIFQFKKDDKLQILGQEIQIPSSNRLILFFDKVHKEVPIRQEFLEYWENAEEGPTSYLLSGFDAIIDMEVMEKRLQELEPHLVKMKERYPNTLFYFEGAFYMNPRVKELVSKKISKYADILGMNEEELEEQVERLGEHINNKNLDEIIYGLDRILSIYPVKGIVLHTKDYSMYYGEELKGIDMEQGLTMGNMMSATRARIGKYGTIDECRETLQLPLSRIGLQLAEAAEQKKLKKIIRVVPSRYLEYPKYTIGLGDTFVSGVHTCFIKRS
jgi:ADP-dependent phosphofructokinase/glucokinase